MFSWCIDHAVLLLVFILPVRVLSSLLTHLCGSGVGSLVGALFLVFSTLGYLVLFSSLRSDYFVVQQLWFLFRFSLVALDL